MKMASAQGQVSWSWEPVPHPLPLPAAPLRAGPICGVTRYWDTHATKLQGPYKLPPGPPLGLRGLLQKHQLDPPLGLLLQQESGFTSSFQPGREDCQPQWMSRGVLRPEAPQRESVTCRRSYWGD